MKIERAKPTFQPATIAIETQAEADLLLRILQQAHTNRKQWREDCGEIYEFSRTLVSALT